jgi:SAM-dependent methyltransferase
MTDQLMMAQNMYKSLPYIYDEAGFSHYALEYTPIYLNFLQQRGWIGRRILDLGCGTGVSLHFFSQQRMMVTGVDSSEGMIAVARQRLKDVPYDVTLIQEDLRRYTPPEKTFDLALSIGDTLNYIPSVRDLETLFQRVNFGLEDGRTFLFDLRTVRSMAEDFGQKTQILVDDPKIFVVGRNRFDYESSTLAQHFTFFYHHEQPNFQRDQEVHVLRGYPFRAVLSMLQRCGFELKHALDLNLGPFDPATDPHGRVVVIAEKVRHLAQQGPA